MAASNSAMALDIALKGNLEIQAKNYNDPIGKIPPNLLRDFNGSAVDCYEFIEQIKLIVDTNNWPTGLVGTPQQGPHFEGGATATINWNNHNTWLCTIQAVRIAIAAGAGGAGLSQIPAHANQTWTNQLLDGVQVIPGQVLTAHAGIDGAQTTRSIITGRWRTQAVAGATTAQFQPINTCERSKKIIDFIAQKFTGSARTTWLQTPENE